jgi:hypothetical protein
VTKIGAAAAIASSSRRLPPRAEVRFRRRTLEQHACAVQRAEQLF